MPMDDDWIITSSRHLNLAEESSGVPVNTELLKLFPKPYFPPRHTEALILLDWISSARSTVHQMANAAGQDKRGPKLGDAASL